MAVFILKLALTFLVLAIVNFCAIGVLGFLFDEGVLNSEYEEKTAEVTVKSLFVLGGTTVIFTILWLIACIWFV